MKVCYLTQTASDISDYYKAFFKGKDLFFITFKKENPNALAFVPKSTWSDGRNKLWEELKDKYDYYVFIDDDLIFHNLKPALAVSPFLCYLFYRLTRRNFSRCYEPSKPACFFSRLEYYLQKYKPEVAAVPYSTWDPAFELDEKVMSKNSFVRRLGYFDAQFTVLSNYAASKILPYDTKISGWWSSQIPVYLYTYHVFRKKAINLFELSVANRHHTGEYVENYDGLEDCKLMLAEISRATNKDYITLAKGKNNSPVDHTYGKSEILQTTIKPTDTEDYKLNYEKSLKGLENLLHKNMVP